MTTKLNDLIPLCSYCKECVLPIEKNEACGHYLCYHCQIRLQAHHTFVDSQQKGKSHLPYGHEDQDLILGCVACAENHKETVWASLPAGQKSSRCDFCDGTIVCHAMKGQCGCDITYCIPCLQDHFWRNVDRQQFRHLSETTRQLFGPQLSPKYVPGSLDCPFCFREEAFSVRNVHPVLIIGGLMEKVQRLIGTPSMETPRSCIPLPKTRVPPSIEDIQRRLFNPQMSDPFFLSGTNPTKIVNRKKSQKVVFLVCPVCFSHTMEIKQHTWGKLFNKQLIQVSSPTSVPAIFVVDHTVYDDKEAVKTWRSKNESFLGMRKHIKRCLSATLGVTFREDLITPFYRCESAICPVECLYYKQVPGGPHPSTVIKKLKNESDGEYGYRLWCHFNDTTEGQHLQEQYREKWEAAHTKYWDDKTKLKILNHVLCSAPVTP